jgi:CRP-like cAMP-binding protein
MRHRPSAGDSASVASAWSLGPATAPAARRNHLLASLGDQTLADVVACAEHVRLPERALVYEAGEPITHVDFPLSGLVSIVAISREGSTVEVGPVGCDGMVGLPVFLDGNTDPLEACVQVGPMQAVRVPAPAFRGLAEHHPDLQRVLRRYVQWSYFGLAQWVLCGRLHPPEERLGRWLLLCQDRLGQEQFPLDHEHLGQMLGVRRAGVTIAAGLLRKSGLIDYERGVVRILDRARLAEAACECNRVAAEEYRRLIGRGPEASRVEGGLLDERATPITGGVALRGR